MYKKNANSKIGKLRKVCLTIFSALFALAGSVVVCATLYLCVTYVDAKPIMLSSPEVAENTVTGMMDAVCAGDYAAASEFILGKPDFGAEDQPQDTSGQLIWNAFLESLNYELLGECYTTESGLAQNIRFSYLDVPGVTSLLRERSQALLEQRVADAKDVSEIYDENNEYRTDFVEQVLHDATCDVLQSETRTIAVEFVVNLKYVNDEWWIIADTELLDILFGDILF